ncbi:type VI secretion system amidase effector protein Tae4 [Metapseudomonas otitidis]|uniref:type VI secretion system amidase effector protein Tae4 n=1 Tax=Metapseudomonas otitidis TaxID=319939 RepID=UPI001CA3ACFE|nr:type VI secretion system amidase effector protein Tae4 [Pseudomonas otitidis]QZX80716.1 type VI secretion system amidase effector protein Tae4 [Pseudomonas otitidis]
MAKPAFINLWNNYPTEQHPCDGGWDNQCAIRMSLTLNAERSITIDRNTYPEPKCAHSHARGAESLANWLWRNHLGRPQIFTDGAAAKRTLNERTGIIFFKDCFTRSGETRATGDHIDLWNRGLTKTYDDPANRAAQVWFWELA